MDGDHEFGPSVPEREDEDMIIEEVMAEEMSGAGHVNNEQGDDNGLEMVESIVNANRRDDSGDQKNKDYNHNEAKPQEQNKVVVNVGDMDQGKMFACNYCGQLYSTCLLYTSDAADE